MNNINSNLNYNIPTNYKGDNNFIIEAHSSPNMKLERPKVNAANFIQNLPSNKKYTQIEMNKNMDEINNDIYKKAKKEKSHHEFNFKRYFTIFGIVALLTAIFSHYRKG